MLEMRVFAQRVPALLPVLRVKRTGPDGGAGVTPYRHVMAEVLRRCAREMRAARLVASDSSEYGIKWWYPSVEQWLTEAARLAAQYRDLRDALRMLAEIEDNVICCFCSGDWKHAPGCALERVVG